MITSDQPRVVRSHASAWAAALLSTGIAVATANGKDVAVKIAELPTRHRGTEVRGVDFSPDGSRLAEDSDGDSVNIWDWRNQRLITSTKLPMGFNPVEVSNGVEFSSDGQLLGVCAGRGAGNVFVLILNSNDGKVARELTDEGAGGCTGLGFSPSGDTLFFIVDRAGNPGNLVIANAIGNAATSFGLTIDRFFSPSAISISPDGQFVAVGGDLESFQKDTSTSRPKVYLINIQHQKVESAFSTEAIGPIAWSPDGKRIAIAGGTGDVEILDSASGAKLLSTKYEHAAHLNVRFTADGRYLIESDYNGRGTGLGVKIWNSSHKTLLQEIHGNVSAIAISRDSRYLAVGEGGRTTIWQFK